MVYLFLTDLKMPTKTAHLFISLILVLAIATPSVVQLVDKNCEFALILEVGDDDTEKEEKESKEILELKYFVNDQGVNSKSLLEIQSISGFHLNTFKELHSENISPPPEYV